jgi:hypothetical protein
MVDMMYVAAVMAFAPTLILMYVVLRNYTYPKVEQPFFSDPTLFGLFAVGLVAGTIMFAAYTWLDPSNMIYMIIFAAIQCFALVVVLNLKRFHGKSDSVFYGYGLGLGMGCTMAFGTIYYFSAVILGTEEGAQIDAAGFVWMFIIALSHLLMISALGTTVGEGVARKRPMEFAVKAIMVNVVYSLVMVTVYNAGNELLLYAGVFVALAVAAVYFYLTLHVRLSRVVKDVLKMEGKSRKDVPR